MERKTERNAINSIMVTHVKNDRFSLVSVHLCYNLTVYYSLAMIFKYLNFPDIFLWLNTFEFILFLIKGVCLNKNEIQLPLSTYPVDMTEIRDIRVQNYLQSSTIIFVFIL